MTTPDINRILAANPRSCARGAPLGDRNLTDAHSPLYLQRVRFTDGCYAPDNTYWGMPADLWCAFNGEDDDFAPAMGTRIYVRAKNRREAALHILADHDVTFRRA